MRKILLALLSVFSVMGAFAQTEPAITFTAEVDGNERELEVGLSAEGTVQVDWGDGNLVTSDVIPAFDGWNQATVSGTVKGEGQVKIYGDNISYFSCISRVDGAKLSALDVTNATALKQLYANANNLTSIDLSKNTGLEIVDIQNNKLTAIDVTNNVNLTKLTVSDNLLTAIDISNNQALATLYISNNKFAGELDLSSNPTLKSIYALNNEITSVNLGANTASKPYFSFNNNKLTSFDASKLTQLSSGTLFLIGNQLTEITLPEGGVKTLNISSNNFTFATLPRFSSTRYTYAPQADYAVEASFKVNDEIDLSAQTDATINTVYGMEKADGTPLTEGTDYTVTDGKVKLLTPQESAYVTMTSEYYPKFTGTSTYKTTAFTVKESVPAITFTAEIDGNERELEVGLSAEGTVQVDWGDGNLVTSDVIPAFDGWNQATVSGTVKGEGQVKIYGDNISYFSCISRVDGAKLSALDVTNATALKQLYANANNLTSIDLSKNTGLEIVDIQNNKLTAIDVTNNVNLTKLTVSDNLLTAIDISNNQALATLYISNNKFAGELDLSSNPTLKSIYALNNEITSVNLGANTASKPYFSFNNNKLTSFDASKLTQLSSGTLFLIGNQLTEITLPEGGVKTLNISSNNFTFATLPRFSSTRYTYAPQADYAVEASFKVNDEIDLSAQTDATINTVYGMEKADGTPLTEGTDYTVTDGKVKLLTPQESAYVTMTSEYYPKFTGTSTYKTTAFTVEAVADDIADLDAAAVKVTATEGGITVTGLSAGDNVTVCSVNGAVVADTTAAGTTVSVPAGKGVYVIKVNDKAFKISK